MRTLRALAGVALALSCTSALAAQADPLAAVRHRLAGIEKRAQVQQDERDIENLQRAYGYYFDRSQWDQIADLFAKGGTFEYAQRGVYVGKAHIRKALALFGRDRRVGHDGRVLDEALDAPETLAQREQFATLQEAAALRVR